MTVHEHTPRLASVRKGQDARIYLDVQNVGDATDRDWTSSTVSVAFNPDAGDTFTNIGVLTGTPTAGPQAYVDLADTDTSSLHAPQSIRAVFTTTLSGGNKDVGSFVVPLTE